MKRKIILTIIVILIIGLIFTICYFLKKEYILNGKKNQYIGEWKLSAIEENGKAITGREYFGSGIMQGGTLILKEDLTYYEYIGVQGENIEDYEGTYTLNKNIITLKSKTGIVQQGIINEDIIAITDKIFDINGLVFKFKRQSESIK